MAKAPSKIVLIVAAFIAIAAMIVLNQMSQKITPKSDEEQEQEQQKAAADAAAKNPSPAPKAATKGPTDDLVSLGQDTTLGATSAAAPEVTVRWSWSPTVQSDPAKLNAAIRAVVAAVPNARVHVVNTDETPDVPDGVFVGSKVVASATADGSLTVDPSAVKAAVGK